jgi:maleylpyruvate isomerase
MRADRPTVSITATAGPAGDHGPGRPMRSREWLADTTSLFLAGLDTLSDGDLDAPTELPGWTRRHLVAHVHFNALALGRLVSWAATGTESRMYPSRERRNAEIEEGATLPAEELRRLVHASAGELDAALDALTPEGWEHPVVTGQGRTVAAVEIPWMRARELAVHAVDLGAGATFADLPEDLVTTLLVDVVTMRAASGEGAPLAAWLTGRSTQAPPLGPWL